MFARIAWGTGQVESSGYTSDAFERISHLYDPGGLFFRGFGGGAVLDRPFLESIQQVSKMNVDWQFSWAEIHSQTPFT
jgi:hypothetical protein